MNEISKVLLSINFKSLTPFSFKQALKFPLLKNKNFKNKKRKGNLDGSKEKSKKVREG